MLAGPGVSNAWVISAEERAKHDSQFFTLKPVNGFVTGAQAKQFFMQSGLPVAVLGHVWGLADINQDGKMDKREFSIAMHLIKKKLQGIELPKALPSSLKQDPAPTMGSFGPSANPPGSIPGPTPVMGMRPATGLGGFAPGGPVPTAPGAPGFASPGQGFPPMNGASANHPSYLGGSATLPHSGLGTKVVQSPNLNMAPVVSVVEWAIPHTMKLKYNQLFNQHDRMRKGSIGGMEAKAILSSTGLTHGFLAQIWNLADIDADGQLTNDEFCVAMHLVDMAKSGQTLPQKLPPELIPPSFRRGRSGSTNVTPSVPTSAIPPPQPTASATLPRSFASNFTPSTNSMPAAPAPVQQQDSFGDLLGGFAAVPSSPAPAVPPAVPEPSEPEPASNVTFEDKRKENFDKGQAELERRRAQLQEELKKQEEERLAAERAEHEKRERVRLEQERKKQQELEKQLEKQRQLEQEREEQRRKVLEQREAARREMERQRQLEWERQRRDQLNSEKQREHQQVDRLHSEVGELKLELEALDNKKAELKAKIELAKKNVNEFTTTIDGMRQTRDRTLTEIDQYQKDAIDWNRKAARSQHEKKQLESQVQGSSSQNDDAYKGISNNVSSKKSNTEKLKSDFSKIETETASVLKEIDSRNNKLMEVADALTAANAEVLRLREEYEMKQEEWNMKKKSGTSFSAATSSSNAWGSDPPPFSSYSSSAAATAQTSASTVDAWGSSQTTTATTSSSNAWGDMFSADQVDGQSKQLALSLPEVRRISHTYARTTSSERELTTLWEDASLQQWADFSQFDGDLFKSSAKSSSQDTSWANSFFSDLKTAPKKAETTEPAPASGESQAGSKRHVAMYQFDARNSDELSLTVGDTVWVKADQSGAEPGWLSGECNGRSGWFPEAYVQPEEEGVSNGFDQQTEFASQEANNHKQDFGSTPSLLTTSEQSSFTAVPSSGPSPTPGEIAKEPLQACALYPWRAKKENHLTFDSGDIILVKEQQDMWWSGELHGMSGWFPKSYVKLMGSSVTASSALEQAQGEAPPVDEPAADLGNTTSELYVAAYTYSSPEPGDLSFVAGEPITVTKKTDDWWTGTIGDRTGIFPANYVTEYQEEAPVAQPEPAAEDQQLQPQVATEQQRSGTRRNSRLSSSSVNSLDSVPEWGLSQVSQKLSATKKPEIATVIAPYQATGPEQLSLNPGQLIQVRKKSNSGWWEGELQARGQKRRVGWFPANYVKMLSSSARNTPDATSAAQKSLSPTPQPGDGSRSETPVSMPQPTSAPAVEQVVALYNYDAQREDELTFTKGGVISVIDKDDPDWWRGEFNGLTGVFPSNYVSPMSEEQSSWSPNQSVVPMTSDMEAKRQSHIQELITTEESYRKDLNIMLDVFAKNLQPVLTQEEYQTVFVNWKEIIMCNTKLVKSLRVRKKMTGEGQQIPMIGDILCENLPHMTPYVRYCSCQLNASALIQKKTEDDARFKEANKVCIQDQRTKGMPISSYMLKPTQRITRYPLLIEKILKNTPAEHPDHQNLQEALNKANELCNQVNEGVREKENSDKLEWIQAHTDCDGLSEKITFNSVTNCLGPRKYLHSGTLYKAKSGKELVGLLFSDFLLLAQPQRSLGSAASVFSFDVKANTRFKMYRSPIFLNEVMVKKPPENDADSQVFHLHHVDRVYTLKAISTTERDVWVKKIEAASKHYLETERKKREKAHSAHLELRSSAVGRLLVMIIEGTDLSPGILGSVGENPLNGCGRLLIVVEEGCHLVPSDSNVRKIPVVGRLLVVILEGCSLVPGEDGKSDPYCEVSMGAQEHKTKVINNTLNPKWNASMQFTIKDLQEDVLCITVYDRDLFTPNDFLGRTEVRINDIHNETRATKGPITKHLQLFEVDSGEVVVKLDLQLFGES